MSGRPVTRIVIGALCCALVIQPSAAMAKTKSHGAMFWIVGGLATGAVALGALQKRQCKKAVTSGQIGADIPRPCFADQVLERSYGTGTLRGQLDIERQAMGMPPNPNDCDGHHIVPQKEGRVWAEKAARESRDILEKCDIDINSAQNGVYLPSRKDGSQNCDGPYHKGLHTKVYYDYVAGKLSNAKYQMGCDGVKQALRAIKQDLTNGVIW